MDCIIFPQYHICLQSLLNIRFVDNIQIIFEPLSSQNDTLSILLNPEHSVGASVSK